MASQAILEAEKAKKVKYRLSVSGQLFSPRKPLYHIVQVDSFSLNADPFTFTPQVSVVLELPFKKHPLWSTVLGLGMGASTASMVFKTDGRFPTDKNAVDLEQDLNLGSYGILNFGLARQHASK